MIKPGMKLDRRYRLVEPIASGGMGEVWRGVDDTLGRTVAVKILLRSLLDEPGFAERFRGEARAMASINHGGVVEIYDYGSDRSAGAFLVMEYVNGDALSRVLARFGRLTPGRTMALIAQAADALQAAHNHGVVHRDVKPANLLVRENGTLVLTDFGIAKSAGSAQLTAPGSVLGTAAYVAPEVANGGKATPLSDVYSLGVVAYQCLTGKPPFTGNTPMDTAMRHVREQPAPLPPDIPPSVRMIVERALAKEPGARWPTAAAFGESARRAAAELGIAASQATAQARALAPPHSRGRVFISYRNGDTEWAAGRVNDELTRQFGTDNVVMDVDRGVPGGQPTAAAAVSSCDAVIVLIGANWLGTRRERHLDRPDDHVRIEVEAALTLGKRIVPILVEAAPMPRPDQLPTGMTPLARLTPIRLDHAGFRDSMRDLVRRIGTG
jgi:protein kinase-like protein/TIR domain-containing protein